MDQARRPRLGGPAPQAAGTGGSTTADFIVHAKTKGAFAGIAIDGSVVDVRQKLNAAYCGKPVTPVEILVKGEASNSESARLQAALKQPIDSQCGRANAWCARRCTKYGRPAWRSNMSASPPTGTRP